MIKSSFLAVFCLSLFAGGFVVYEDSKKVVIQCDDNRTSLSIEKDAQESELKDKIEKFIHENCKTAQ